MRKLLLLIFCLLICSFATLNNSALYEICEAYPSSQLSIYCDNLPVNYKGDFIVNGGGYIIQTNAKDGKYILDTLNNINGFSLVINSNYDKLKELLKNVRILKIEEVAENKVVYAYLPELINFCMVDGKKVNLQIAYNEQRVILGSPLILGSF